MPLIHIDNKVPYGDTYAVEHLTECDGNCTEECYEQECNSAAKCPFCGEIYCTEEHDGCPNNCEQEDFYDRMQKHMQDLCPFPITREDVKMVDGYCLEHECNPNLSTLKEVFKDRFAQYKLTKRKRRK